MAGGGAGAGAGGGGGEGEGAGGGGGAGEDEIAARWCEFCLKDIEGYGFFFTYVHRPACKAVRDKEEKLAQNLARDQQQRKDSQRRKDRKRSKEANKKGTDSSKAKSEKLAYK